jgi:hypothetical protein
VQTSYPAVVELYSAKIGLEVIGAHADRILADIPKLQRATFLLVQPIFHACGAETMSATRLVELEAGMEER